MKKHPTIELLESLNDALIYCIESSVCLAVLYLVYYFFLRKSSPLNYNRAYLLLALMLSVAFPLIELSYDPNQAIPVFHSLNQFGNEVGGETILQAEKAYIYTITAKSEKPFLLWWEALILIYFIVVLIMGLKLFVRLRLIKEFIWYKRHVTRYKERYFLVQTEGQMATMSFMNYLFYDNSQNLSNEEKMQVIAHEKAHIDQKHSYDVLFTEILKVVFWFNPLIYLYKNLLTETHEYLADQKAARSSDVQSYTQLLVQSVFKKMGFDLASPFNKNPILKRVQRLKATQQHSRLKFFMPIPFAFVLFFIFSFDAVENLKWEAESLKISSEIFHTASQLPKPEMGQAEWKKYVEQNTIIQKQLSKESLPTQLDVRFRVNEQGDLTNFSWVNESPLPIDWIKNKLISAGKWKPAIINGKNSASDIQLTLRAVR